MKTYINNLVWLHHYCCVDRRVRREGETLCIRLYILTVSEIQILHENEFTAVFLYRSNRSLREKRFKRSLFDECEAKPPLVICIAIKELS